MDRSQQQIMRRRRARARFGPERLEQGKNTALLSGEPERSRQAHIGSRGFQWHRSGAIPDQRRDFLGRAEIRLVDDAGLAVDAGALDDIVVKFVGLLLGDEGRHIG